MVIEAITLKKSAPLLLAWLGYNFAPLGHTDRVTWAFQEGISGTLWPSEVHLSQRALGFTIGAFWLTRRSPRITR